MGFKKYLKDRITYIIIYYLSILLVIFIMMLDLIIRKEPIKISNVFYCLILSSILLGLLIVIDYSKKKKFYEPINYGMEREENLEYIFNIPENISKEHDFLKEVLTRNYLIYMSILEKNQKKFKRQMDFNNRWIHEMKTPVSVIKLMLENEKDKNIEEITRKNYESIEEEIEKLSNGLEMALHTLRINDFELDFKVEEVSLNEIIRTVINENKSTFIVNSIYPKLVAEENVIVKSDKKWVKFIISQLLSNSIKYTKVKENGDKNIILHIYEENGKTILSIRDKGVGIPKGDLDRVFEPFFTGKNGRKYLESTGMGLYLLKDICDKLGHGIKVESIEGKGTTVSITFYKGKSIYNIQ